MGICVISTLATINKVAVDIHMSYIEYLFLLSGMFLEMELLGHMVAI